MGWKLGRMVACAGRGAGAPRHVQQQHNAVLQGRDTRVPRYDLVMLSG